MIEWVLDNLYPELRDLSPKDEQIIYVIHGRESDLLPVMIKIVEDYPTLRFSSLPHLGEVPHIELSLRGHTDQIEEAMALLKAAIERANLRWLNQLDKQ
jgi:molybdopterin-biosynthesis enzyme MoeA-like protein